MKTQLSIISVSYNSAQIFFKAWQQFLQESQVPAIIVDNASPDGSGARLSQGFPNRDIVLLPKNIGYGGAANAALKRCQSRYALLLNPDILISETAIRALYQVALDNDGNTAMWGPALKESDFTGGPPIDTEALIGAAMLFDLEKIRRIGFFDENIFLYSEETDLCYRTRRHGYAIKFCPSIYMGHIGNHSSEHHPDVEFMKHWHFGWSRCYYLEKHGLCTKKRNPRRMLRDYRIKSFISLHKAQRLCYRGQAEGVAAFLRGEKAFTADGNPQKSPA